MRGHGVPNFPDPSASGGYSLGPGGTIEGAGGSVDINSSPVQAAYGHCRHLLPGGPSVSQLEQKVQQGQQREEQELPTLVKFAQCMRSHGVPGFPDPALSGQSAPASGKGPAINPSSPGFKAALQACRHLVPAGAHIFDQPVGRDAPAMRRAAARAAGWSRRCWSYSERGRELGGRSGRSGRMTRPGPGRGHRRRRRGRWSGRICRRLRR